MSDMNSLMQKLAVSKQIMNRHDDMVRGQVRENTRVNIPQEYQEPIYNIPSQPQQVSAPVLNEQKIMSSNLPEEIKRLMIENPIAKPDSYSATLPNDVIEGAAKLIQNQSGQPKKQNSQTTVIDENFKTMLRNLVRDTVRDVIKEELGQIKEVITESKPSNETMKLSIGKHIFEGKITNVKKLK